MARPIVEADDEGKRVTVLFNLRDWGRIEKEIKRCEGDTGYEPSVSDVLRRLVRAGLPE